MRIPGKRWDGSQWVDRPEKANKENIKPRKVHRGRKSGIYVIFVTGGVYVGQSVDISNRIAQHRNVLRKGRHSNKELQRLFSVDGEFRYSYTECDRSELNRKEEETIKEYHGQGFNVLNRLFCVDTSIVNIPKSLVPLIKKIVDSIQRGKLDPDSISQQLEGQ